MPYYFVKSRVLETEPGITELFPDVDVDYIVVRPYREHDDVFVIYTKKTVEGLVEVQEEHPAVTSRLGWWWKHPGEFQGWRKS